MSEQDSTNASIGKVIDRERIRGASRLIPTGTDAKAVTDEQIQQVAADVESFRRDFSPPISKAAIAKAAAERDASSARYRVAEKDLDVEVTSRYAELVETEEESQARRGGLERLRRYRTSLESRKASGQGVAADLLKTDVRIASDEADAIDADARAAQARTELNVLMGRAPDAPLTVVAPPIPTGAPAASTGPPPESPEVREAEALARGTDADVLAAEAERKPHLFASADAGWWGADTTRWSIDRWRRDAGFSLGLQVSWLLFDFGASDARIARARIEGRRARLEIVANAGHCVDMEQPEALARLIVPFIEQN